MTINRVWSAIGELTYAEMIELAKQLELARDTIGLDAYSAISWAEVIEHARRYIWRRVKAMTDPIDTARLRELLNKATPGEWEADDRVEQWWNGEQPGCMVRKRVGNTGHALANCKTQFAGHDHAIANAALIAALHNAAPALLDEIDHLRAELAEARRERARTTLTSFVEGLDEGRYHLLDLPADLLERMRQAFLPEHSEHRGKTDD